MLTILLFISFSAFAQEDIERYKLYPTDNINIHLKLDTQWGYVYMVQRRSNDVESMTIQIDEVRPHVYRKEVISSEERFPIGRYKLYPTQNMWTFLLLDVIDGHTYQVQWGFDNESRFVEIIDSE